SGGDRWRRTLRLHRFGLGLRGGDLLFTAHLVGHRTLPAGICAAGAAALDAILPDGAEPLKPPADRLAV
ncbi:MAG TPA: hypothetical protein VFL28_11740, partial [bacterium]|nr:hypothetical protein [bacterium]